MKKDKDILKIIDLQNFIKEAFCVDGEVTIEFKERTYPVSFKVTDSKKGCFHVSFDYARDSKSRN